MTVNSLDPVMVKCQVVALLEVRASGFIYE